MRNRIFLMSLCFTTVFASPDIDKIRTDISVLEKNDVSKNINKSKANTSTEVLEVSSNSTDVDLGIPAEAPQKKQAVIPANKDTMYFSLLSKIENQRDAEVSLKSVAPLKVNHYALKSNTNLQGSNATTTSTTSNANTKTERSINFSGVCQFDNLYNISQEITVNLPCRFEDKILVLNITLKPNNSNYELNGVPNFLMYDELNNGTYSKRIFIDTASSTVKNSSGTSNNIATFFDSRKIDKLLGLGAKEMSSAFANGTKQTFDDYRSYKTKNNIQYDPKGNVIVTTDTQKPDIATNLTYSAIEGVFRVVEKGVEMLNVESLPALYQVVKGSIINVELYSKTTETTK